MTIERTRQIFGDKFADLSDKEVLAFIGDMSIVCDEALKDSLSALKQKKKKDRTKQ